MWYDYDQMPPMDEAAYHRLLDIFLPSEEMREYLKKEPMLRDGTILDLIIGAPVPLSEKVKWAWGEFRKDAEMALAELTLRPGEILTLTDAWYDEDIRDEKLSFNAPFLSWEKVMEHIHGEMAEYGDDWYDCQWYVLEKWIPTEAGEMEQSYTYWIIGDQVMYYSGADDENRTDHIDPNLPVPFHVGDILTIDCRPFAPVKHALLIERGDNCDCCCLQGLCLDEKTGLWITGAVKHWSLFGHFLDPLYTAIYRLSCFDGELPPAEQPLLEVQKAIGCDEEKGRELWNLINGFRSAKGKGSEDELTDERLLDLAKEIGQM